DILRTKPVWLGKGSYFIAQGVLETGGATFALIREEKTAGFVEVTSRGPFVVALKVPDDGFYWFGLANNVDICTSLENRFVVSRAGWIQNPGRPRDFILSDP